ncbi:cytochrome P450 monooxygenase CYP63 [Collybia nuda]|uniref:Cytochrome P450 monooxygenase CYP63 n=1 Tax=Collybia nuda TaxID=64659 RepID=A0A9P5YCK7_9AGAR|nr:cytochrome P450 monooxygenase CYP63 [Collybia nuda]
MNPALYRVRLFLDLCRTIFLPSLILSLTLSFARRRLGLLTVPAHIIFIIIWASTKGALSKFIQDREAIRLGAKPIPRIVGKWPGNIDILLKMLRAFKTSYVLDVYLQLFEEYQCTTLNTRILWSDNIISMDQEHAKFVLTTGFNHFWRGKMQKERMETFLGEGIFNRDDEIWRMHRSMARPFFARDRVSDFENFEKHTTRTISILSALANANQPCEAQDLYARFTIDAGSEFLFGRNLDTLSGILPVPGKTPMGPKGSATEDSWGTFSGAFEMAQQIVTTRARIGYLWPLSELFGDKTEPHIKVIHDWLDPLVKNAIENKLRVQKSGIFSPTEDKNFLQHLAESTDDPILIRDELLSMLLAARDTTACVLTYITYFMATVPLIATKLRAEVLEHCGPQAPATYERIRDLKYMRAVINETLRLFPPVPLNVRESRASPCLLPPSDPSYPESKNASMPFYMPGSTTIIYLPLIVQRNKALWGPDADDFDPERWLQPERIANFVANPSMFTPFSAGPRICIGQNYAYNEISYFLVNLLQRFDRFTLAPEVQPEGSLPPPEWKNRKGRQKTEHIWPSAAMTLYVKGGMWVNFHKVQS